MKVIGKINIMKIESNLFVISLNVGYDGNTDM